MQKARYGSYIVVVLIAAFSIFLGTASAQKSDNVGQPIYKAEPLNKALQHTATTIPYFSSSFTWNGTTYPYTMVGTDPAAGAGRSYVPVTIIPIKVVFANGVNLDGGSKASLTIDSPIFQDAQFESGKTQYGDAIQRAEFWGQVESLNAPGYHVLLDQPRLAPTQTIVVPQNQGTEFTGSVSQAPIGLVSYSWWSSRIQNLVSSLKIDPRTVPVFLTYNTLLYIQSPSNCCVIGYHGGASSANGNGVQQVNTYMWASWTDPKIFSVPIEDINALSHEMAEWMNDPFVQNVVPAWSVPSEPQYGCSNYLEVGDPLVGVVFTVTTNGYKYHPQDEAFLPWFAKTSSTSYKGRYTYLGTFMTYSPGCS